MQNPSMITCKMEVRSLQPIIPTCLSPKGSFMGNSPNSAILRATQVLEGSSSFTLELSDLLFKELLMIVNAYALGNWLGAASFSSAAVEATSENVNSKDEDTVFVAGATGRVGSRTVRELLKLGFRVKAGVRSAQRAESLVQSVRQMKLDPEVTGGVQSIEKLELVECDLEKRDQIVPALGRASVVICCIGASEKEILDVTGPYRIDYQATKNLIDAGNFISLRAATVAKVDHFILITSLGTNKFGFPAALLNLFWGVLLWKRKAEEALIGSGLPYAIVRPGGMERPTDSFKETHNLILYPEDTLSGGLVSNLQVAELLAFMALNRELSYCKIVEAIAETTAPLTPMGELLAKIPSKRAYLPKAKKPDAASQLLEPEPKKSPISEVPTSPTGKETGEEERVVPRPLSPYTVYDDLKPPTSPAPAAPSSFSTPTPTASAADESQMATTSNVDEAEPVKADEAGDVEDSTEPKSRPLSPYTMYDDMKPPTSPAP
ncbi:hypothetical protein Cgig2_032490 [Carnegiea gigantea]|uniref:NAD(P)-binding domain-containing protein n=1 Tax=Carnegiea gigantea TaxID=171969 RepID=A0A9Q1KXH2_9CARY|nr:hypothetical protein Cgig2_032490 [Carnegiea gigantea]